MGMGALAMLLSETKSVNLNGCCGGGNEANIDLNFEVNIAAVLRQATASMPESQRDAILAAAGITGDEGMGEAPVVITPGSSSDAAAAAAAAAGADGDQEDDAAAAAAAAGQDGANEATDETESNSMTTTETNTETVTTTTETNTEPTISDEVDPADEEVSPTVVGAEELEALFVSA